MVITTGATPVGWGCRELQLYIYPWLSCLGSLCVLVAMLFGLFQSLLQWGGPFSYHYGGWTGMVPVHSHSGATSWCLPLWSDYGTGLDLFQV